MVSQPEIAPPVLVYKRGGGLVPFPTTRELYLDRHGCATKFIDNSKAKEECSPRRFGLKKRQNHEANHGVCIAQGEKAGKEKYQVSHEIQGWSMARARRGPWREDWHERLFFL
jgi:hypothetical protein